MDKMVPGELRPPRLGPLAFAISIAACTGAFPGDDPRRPSPHGDAGTSFVPVGDAGSAPRAERPPRPETTFPIATPAEVARRLARFLWSTGPDAELVHRLEASRPLDPPAVARVAGDMLRDPRARSGVRAFFRWWLDLHRLADVHVDPEPGEELRIAMAAETETFGVHVVLDGDGRLGTLLTAPFTFVNEPLARLYGNRDVMGPAPARIAVDTSTRLGILGHAGVIALSSEKLSWPSMRGNFVLRAMACNGLWVDPPAGEPELLPGRSIRRQQIEMTGAGTCQSCHRLMDNPGFAFLPFDSVGRHSAMDGDVPVNAAGFLPDPVFKPEERFSDLPDLARRLARRPEVARCTVRLWRAFAVLATRETPASSAESDRFREQTLRIELPEEATEVDDLAADLDMRDLDIRQVMMTVMRSQTFLAPAK